MFNPNSGDEPATIPCVAPDWMPPYLAYKAKQLGLGEEPEAMQQAFQEILDSWGFEVEGTLEFFTKDRLQGFMAESIEIVRQQMLIDLLPEGGFHGA